MKKATEPVPIAPPKTLAVPTDFVNALLRYLDTRPHGEVRGFIDGFATLARDQGFGQPPPAQETAA